MIFIQLIHSENFRELLLCNPSFDALIIQLFCELSQLKATPYLVYIGPLKMRKLLTEL